LKLGQKGVGELALPPIFLILCRVARQGRSSNLPPTETSEEE
jgi:hypothetical protein